MSSTLLQLIQQATGEMGISVPTYVAANTATDSIQQLALLNALGYELQQQYEWEHAAVAYRFTTAYLTTTGNTTINSPIVTNIPSTATLSALNFTATGSPFNADTHILTVDSATQVTLSQNCTSTAAGGAINFCKTKYTMPTDYDRQIEKTQWDKTKHWAMLGPVTAQQWELLKSGYISTGPRIRYRIFGGKFQIWPPLTSNEYLGFEYMSNYWALDVSGTAKGSFTVDTDTCVFPDRLMVLGLKLKYFEVKGFDTTALNRDFNQQLSIAKAADGGSQTLSMAPRIGSILIGPDQIPDSGFGS